MAELARRFPLKCLVRQQVKASLARVDGSGQELLSDKARVVQVGEVLSLKAIGSFCSKSPADKYLKCLTCSGKQSSVPTLLPRSSCICMQLFALPSCSCSHRRPLSPPYALTAGTACLTGHRSPLTRRRNSFP